MVSQCLNPECRASFLYWWQSRLFAVRAAQRSPVESFWLCGTCAGNFTINTGLDGNVTLIRLARHRAKYGFQDQAAA